MLHAALIYPDKLALVHPDIPQPVLYTNAVWSVLTGRRIPQRRIYRPILHRAQRVQNLAYALIKAGISPGDRVAVIAPNTCVAPHSFAHLTRAHSRLV